MALSMQDLSLDDAFDSYCIVCDRVIVPPKVEAPVEAKPKKKAAGAIRIKNPDGSTTTRTANGTKTTRPGLKRNQASASRLVSVATNNNAAAKLAPLSRTKTTESTTSPTSEEPPVVSSPPFLSSIYCSPACAAVEQHRSEAVGKNLARTFSNSGIAHYQHRPSVDGIITNIDVHNHPHGPPSPLFISSDTESSNSQGTAPDAGPASSAPKMMEYFRMSRQGPDDAWNDVQRQRRSSMHPSFRPAEMQRQNTQSTQYTANTASSDSLSSMWDAEYNLGRSTSNPGKMRMTQMAHADGSTSSGPSPIPTRPALPRSNLSHTSLGCSPNDLTLLQSYSDALPVRNGLSTSYNSRPFPVPGSLGVPFSTPFDTRRPSIAGSVRPSYGTIRAKSKQSGPTWDSLGKEYVREQEDRAKRSLSQSQATATSTIGLAIPQPEPAQLDQTPRQSFRCENGKWKIVHTIGGASLGKNGTIRCKDRSSSRSTQSSNSSSDYEQGLRGKPAQPVLSTSNLMPPPSTIPHSASSSPSSVITMTNPSSGRLAQTHGQSLQHPENTPTSRATPSSLGLSQQRRGSGYNWHQFQQEGGKTLPLPGNLQVNHTKAGLFFFQ